MSSESHDRRLPPELELVLLCLRIEPSDADEHRIRTLLGEELDWDELTALLLSHQIVPSFYRRLHAIAPGCAAGGIRSYLEWMTQDLAKRSILFLGEMLRLLSAFEANGILLIPYKGIVQSWLAYRDLAQRTCLDLDFALRQRDIPRAGELLENLGYESWLQPEELRLAERGQFPGQYAFHRRNLELPVELHTERTLRYFPIPINFDALERRLQTIEIGGRAIRTFSLEDTILFLCVHGAKHFWARLNWICDVGRLAAERPDWEKLAATAAEMHCTRSVLLGSVLAHDLLKAPIPESVLSRARRDSKVAQLARQVREQIARNEESPRGILRRARFRLRSRDRLTEGLLHTWRISTRPTERDWSYAADVTGRSGSSSAFFSSLLRPWRLLRQYGRRFTSEPNRDLSIFEPTSPADVERMIEFAGLGRDDVLYDLGCGDGRLVIRAAERCGSRGFGIDVDPQRIAESRANARNRGVEDRVRFLMQDAKKADLSEATVVFLFLGVPGNLRLAHNLRKQLRAGTRVISRGFSIPGWEAEAREESPSGDRALRTLYRWRIGGSPGGSPTSPTQPAAHMYRAVETKKRPA